MNTVCISIIAILWIIGGFVGYFGFFKKWDDHSQFEKIWFSCLWPCVLGLYIWVSINNKLKDWLK